MTVLAAFEVRFNGILLHEAATLAAASALITTFHSDIVGRQVETSTGIAIANIIAGPSRPIRIYCRGNFVDSALTLADGNAYIAAHALAGDAAAWLLVDWTIDDVAVKLVQKYFT